MAQIALATGWTLEYIESLDMVRYGIMLDVLRYNEERAKIKPL